MEGDPCELFWADVMSERLDALPWRLINYYLAQVGAAKSKSHFLSMVVAALLQVVSFDVEGGIFEIMGPCLHAVGASEKRLRAYVDYYQFRQPFLDEMQDGLPPENLLGAQIADWSTRYKHTEMVTDFMIPGGIHKTLTSVLPGNRFVVALHRSRFAIPFSEIDRDVLAVLSPHIKNLYSIWERVGDCGQIPALAEEIAEALPGLTRREAEISSLLCQGLTGSEVASRLFISRRTVESHVAHLYDKLDICRRGELKQRIQSLVGRESG